MSGTYDPEDDKFALEFDVLLHDTPATKQSNQLKADLAVAYDNEIIITSEILQIELLKTSMSSYSS